MPFAERAGVRIHYRDEGTGFPLVLHTGGAGDGTMWDEAGYTRRLGGFRLLVMDHRGRGRSSRVEDLAGHLRAEYADDVVAVAAAAGVERFAFAGQFALSLRAWAAEGDTTRADLAGIACPTALVAGSQEAPPGSLEPRRHACPGRGPRGGSSVDSWP
jgi:hypothetical protein